MQQAQAQLEMQQQAMLAKSLNAKAQSDMASAQEKEARSIADMALAQQHSAQAVHDRAKAALDNAKALKELDELDENRLIKLSDFILSVGERQQQMELNEEMRAVENAQRLEKQPATV